MTKPYTLIILSDPDTKDFSILNLMFVEAEDGVAAKRIGEARWPEQWLAEALEEWEDSEPEERDEKPTLDDCPSWDLNACFEGHLVEVARFQ